MDDFSASRAGNEFKISFWGEVSPLVLYRYRRSTLRLYRYGTHPTLQELRAIRPAPLRFGDGLSLP